MHGADESQVNSFLREIAATQDRPTDIVSRTPTSVVVRIRNPPHGIVAQVLAHGCAILWPAIYSRGEEAYTILAPSRDRFEALVRRLRELGEVHVEKVSDVAPDALHVNVPLSDITTNLTERQLFVLQAAIAQGYYDSPRRTSTEALAVEFGVTRSTLEEHLRKAERRVLEGFAGVLAAQPVLARAATRRPGRPAGATRVNKPASPL